MKIERRSSCFHGRICDEILHGISEQNCSYQISILTTCHLVTTKPPSNPPRSSETTVQPAETETAVQPTETETAVQPAETETAVQPAETETAVQPAETETAVQPAETETAVQPAETETAVQPAETETAVQPAETETTVQPATQPTDAEQPAAHLSTMRLSDVFESHLFELREEDTIRIQDQLQRWKSSEGAASFWKRIFQYARLHTISLKALGTAAIAVSKQRRINRSHNRAGRPSIVKVLVKSLFKNIGTDANFRAALALCMKCGSMEDLINTIRRHVEVPELGYGILPCMTVIKKSTKLTMRYFIGICKPEKCFSGWRVNLVLAVKLAVFMRWGSPDLNGVLVDIWGDGAECGDIDQTRLCFRILGGPGDAALGCSPKVPVARVSAQSARAAVCFCVYRGKDSRYALEQNVGFETVGDQTTGWLFQQTSALMEQGVKLTYSGDSPFLYRLVTEVSSDAGAQFPTNLALYFGTAETPLPEECDVGGYRTKLTNLPFISGVPVTSLAKFDDVRCVVPDVTHMASRCVESDIHKMGQMIAKHAHPYQTEAIRKFERNLTRREVKKPFEFKITFKGGFVNNVAPVKISYGRAALTAIADKEEFFAMDPDMPDLYEGVWRDQIVFGQGLLSNSANVLRKIHPGVFNKPNPDTPTVPGKLISIYDASELLRKGLNRCIIMLRGSKDDFNNNEFEKWAETYYQASILLFTVKGLTPYKLKMLIFPQLINGGFIRSAWDHMCEGLEKSNHTSHGNFHGKTLRGGGTQNSQDPKFLELFFSFARHFATDEDHTFMETVQSACNAVFDDMRQGASNIKVIVFLCTIITHQNLYFL